MAGDSDPRVLARALLGLAFLLGVLAVTLFGTAGTLAYWQAWTFLCVFGVAALAITIDLAVRDPALLARRTVAGPSAEATGLQKLIQSIASLSFLAVFAIAGLSRRDAHVHVPTAVVFAGDVLVLVGFAIVARVFRENTFTAATIVVERGQQIVSTGPYAIVRHPMYAGAFVLMLGVPPALASWWALLALLPLFAVIIWRLLDEERVLVRELAGYDAYRQTVRYRLVPHLW